MAAYTSYLFSLANCAFLNDWPELDIHFFFFFLFSNLNDKA